MGCVPHHAVAMQHTSSVLQAGPSWGWLPLNDMCLFFCFLSAKGLSERMSASMEVLVLERYHVQLCKFAHADTLDSMQVGCYP